VPSQDLAGREASHSSLFRRRGAVNSITEESCSASRTKPSAWERLHLTRMRSTSNSFNGKQNHLWLRMAKRERQRRMPSAAA
jgi:hypothetical protein